MERFIQRDENGRLLFKHENYFDPQYMEYLCFEFAHTHHKEICDYIEAHINELLPPLMERYDDDFSITIRLAFNAAIAMKLIPP
jgi:hypothetical protein